MKILLLTLLFVTFLFSLSCGGISDTSHIKRKWLDVEYAKTSARQKLDIYLPNDGKEPFPAIVFFHGGGFMMGEKGDGQVNSALDGLNRGYAVISVNYRLSGEATFPAYIHDAKAAIRFLKANAQKYNLNPDKIAVWGGSAGGHIAALVATSCKAQDLEDLSLGNETQNSCVNAAVDWFGPIDFLQIDEQFKKSGKGTADHNQASSPESMILGKPIQEVPELAKKANPANYISAETPPFFIQHGTADNLIPTEQSVNFATELEKVIGKEKVTLELLEGAGHGTSQFNEKTNLDKVFSFLDKYLK
jgi:acetyl esterase/lipase